MIVTVFGASGAIGRKVVEEAVAAGHAVRAFTRDRARVAESDRITAVVGDLADAASIKAAVDGAQAVIWAVGATSNTPEQPAIFEAAARALVAAMRATGVRRLVALSGAGITLPGERKPLGGRIMTLVVGVLARHVVEAKRREYDVFSRSELDWTLVRPPRVVPGPASDARAGNGLASSQVTDGTLARYMVRQLDEREFVHRAPFVSN